MRAAAPPPPQAVPETARTAPLHQQRGRRRHHRRLSRGRRCRAVTSPRRTLKPEQRARVSIAVLTLRRGSQSDACTGPTHSLARLRQCIAMTAPGHACCSHVRMHVRRSLACASTRMAAQLPGDRGQQGPTPFDLGGCTGCGSGRGWVSTADSAGCGRCRPCAPMHAQQHRTGCGCWDRVGMHGMAPPRDQPPCTHMHTPTPPHSTYDCSSSYLSTLPAEI